MPTAHGVDVVDLSAGTSTGVRINEGLAPGFGCNGHTILAASRDGSVVAISSDGSVRNRLRIARRAAALAEVSDGLSIVATKAEIVAVRRRDR